jgi:formate hydrogenlyase transcriptional activator
MNVLGPTQDYFSNERRCEEMTSPGEAMSRVFTMINHVADSPTTVLINGETGTGKELVARAIHRLSRRSDRVMIKLNCAAIPANLIESELFGHEKGSFTGATERRIGKFELAHNSTLFLDEIGELPLELQSRLLRVLQEREIERIGGRTVIKTDIRIIAATNRDLQKEVLAGNFRPDLFYRLHVFPIQIPPLRDRKEDIPGLAAHFLIKYAREGRLSARSISPRVMKQLLVYDWPGNVRELEHLIERSILLASGPVIDELYLHLSKPASGIGMSGRYIKTICEVERDHILAVLKLCDGKISGEGGAAEKLRIAPTTLASKIKRLGIKRGVNENI